jgi:hypothetical protein
MCTVASSIIVRPALKRRRSRPMNKLIDVRCTETGTWSVLHADSEVPLSTHGSETEAERAAQAHASHVGARVIVHDRYERVHECPPITDPRPGPDREHPVRDIVDPSARPPRQRRRWLLGLEPVFEGGWLHKGARALRWDVEGELVALALFGDVTFDLSQARSAPSEIRLDAWAVLRDVDVTVPAGTHVEITGGGFRGHLVNHVPAVPPPARRRVVQIRGHTLLGDVTVRAASAD